MTTALVTGGTGFIGSHLTRRLASEGVEVICLARPGSELRPLPAGARYIQPATSAAKDTAKVLAGIAPDYVFHLAAAGVFAGKESLADIVQTNIGLTTALLTAAADWQLKCFFFTGSCSEYSPVECQAYTEDAAVIPDTVYGASKSAAYICGRALAIAYAVPFVNLRLFGVYGPGEAPQRLLPYLIQQLKKNQVAELTGGMQQRDMLYIDDVIQAMWQAMQTPTIAANPVYNVCSGNAVTIKQVGQMLAEATGAPQHLLQWGARPYRENEAMHINGDNTRLCTTTGWRPQTTLKQGIARMVAAADSGG